MSRTFNSDTAGSTGSDTAYMARRYWIIALVAGAASYLDAAVVTTVSISLGQWRRHLDLTASTAGLVGGGLSLATAFGPWLGARIGDRIGRRRFLGLTLVVVLPGVALILLARSGPALVVGVVIVGLAAGADLPTSLAVISDSAPLEVLGRLTGLTQLLWILGVVVTYILGFGLSGLGHLGTQLLVGHLGVLTIVIWWARARVLPPLPTTVEVGRDCRSEPPQSGAVRPASPLVWITAFYLAWSLAASTMSSYGVYFMTVVGGFTQRQAIGLVLATFPLALLVSFAFVRLADTVWRDRLFLVAMVLQVAAFSVAAVTRGVVAAGIVVLLVLYSLSNTFAGEAAYKVWTQILFSPEARSRALGVSMSVARGTAAGFLVLVPHIMVWRPSALLWMLTGCVALSGALGTVVTRRLTTAQRPQAGPAPSIR